MIQWKKVFVSSRFLFDFIHLCNSNIGKTAWNQSYCIYHLWDNKHAHWASAALCVDWIRSKISRCDQGRDRVRLKDLRLHLPMNIWCLSEARASDPLSGHWGVGGNLPYLHLATFQQFLMRMFPHSCCAKELCSSCLHQIKIVPLILNHCRLVFFLPSSPESKYSDSYFIQKANTVPYCETANTSRYWTIVWLRTGIWKPLSATRCWLQSANKNQ